MRGIFVDTISPVQNLDLGKYTLTARLAGGSDPGIAGGLITNIGPDEFIVAGTSLIFTIFPNDKSERWGIKTVDEGYFIDGKWKSSRRLNGDNIPHSTYTIPGFRLPVNRSSMQKVSFYRYE